MEDSDNVAADQGNIDSLEGNPIIYEVEPGILFDKGESTEARTALNILLSLDTMGNVVCRVIQLMELMIVGKTKQGSVLPNGTISTLLNWQKEEVNR